MSVFWLFAHLLGYGALLSQALYLGLHALLGRRDTHRLIGAARRDERIAKLELQLGIGLEYGRDWLLRQPVRGERGMEELIAAGNGACKRTCLGCDKEFRPHDDYTLKLPPAWYQQDEEVRALTDRLCRECYLGATRELDLLTIHGLPEIAS